MNDAYRTIQRQAQFRQKIERSDFLGIACPATTDAEFASQLEAIRKKHFDATHHCWAYRLFDKNRSRSSDAGEPSGSAGKPILSAIETAELFDTAVVVVRWFGGIKLGTGGLSRAYRTTAAGAVEAASIEERFVYVPVHVIIPFERISDAYRLVDPPAVLLAGEEYGDVNVFRFDVRASASEAFARRLTELRLAQALR